MLAASGETVGKGRKGLLQYKDPLAAQIARYAPTYDREQEREPAGRRRVPPDEALAAGQGAENGRVDIVGKVAIVQPVPSHGVGDTSS